MNRRLLSFSLTLVAAPLLAQPPHDPNKKDQPQLPIVVEKVVVSATVAEERRDPISVATLDKEELAQRNRGQDMAMLLAERMLDLLDEIEASELRPAVERLADYLMSLANPRGR